MMGILQKWRWKEPIRISPPHQMHKNWVIFPEKIKGQYALLHSLTPKIAIHYCDNLEDGTLCVDSYYHSNVGSTTWDNWVRGVGPPPIKTVDGWLVLYHAMDTHDPNKYKIGAMLLDLADPTKVRFRSAYPILEPCLRYEMEGGKAGVVYSCGAAVMDDDTLFVYYGAGDTVLCVAHVNLTDLLTGIKTSEAPLPPPLFYQQDEPACL